MKNESSQVADIGSQQAFPVHDVHSEWSVHKQKYDNVVTTVSGGLTKRELLAAMMAQAILTGAVTRACPANEWLDQTMAVKCADALLAALRESQS